MTNPSGEFDVVVVGGGPAGLSAALMLVRARRRVLVVDAGSPRNGVAPRMHGLLGRDHTSPLDLLRDGRSEIEAYRGHFADATVSNVEQVGDGFVVETDTGERYQARRVLVATGLVDELPDIDGLAAQWGTGVVVCPYCDGHESLDRPIAVIATAPMSVFQAKLLRQWSNRIIYFPMGTHQPTDTDATEFAARDITVDHGIVTRVLTGDDGTLIGVETTDGRRVDVERVFIAPPSRPRHGICEQLGAAADPDGWVEIDGTGQTTVAGLFAVGNVVDIHANVAMSIGAGAAVGGAINAGLVLDDTQRAVAALATASTAGAP